MSLTCHRLNTRSFSISPRYPHSIIAAQEGPNDGLVSVQSAQWGTYLGTLRNANHLDLVGWTGGLAGNLTSLAGRSFLLNDSSLDLNADIRLNVQVSTTCTLSFAERT